MSSFLSPKFGAQPTHSPVTARTFQTTSKQKARAIQCPQLAHFLSKFYQQSVGSIYSNESNARKFEINNDINSQGADSGEQNNVQPTARLRFSQQVPGNHRTTQRQ